MTAEQAIGVVEAHRPMLAIEPEFKPGTTERAIVPYKQNANAPGAPEMRIAWIVTLTCSWGFVRVDVEDRTGQVLNVVRSS